MISVCFITKNEEKWIGECIRHLKPIVAEFIVVDTDSTDRTCEIARSEGAKVTQIEWPGDFAQARNVSLELATQPWVMKIDPDERLDPRDFEKFVALTRTNKVGYQCWTRAYTNDPSRVQISSYQICKGEYAELEKGYRGYVVYPNMRLFRRVQGVKYVGKIHESVVKSLPGEVPPPVDIYFHHYGHSSEAIAEKGKESFYQKLVREELEAHPDNWYVQFELGNELFQKQQWKLAIEAFRKADTALPQKPQVLSNLGYALILDGQVAEGEAVLRKCIEVDPRYHDAWLNLGVSRLSIKDYESALQAFEKSLALDPRSFAAYRARGQCLSQLNRFEEAEVSFSAAINLMPHYTEAKIDLAMLVAQTKSNDAALQLVKEALKDEPTHPRANALFDHLNSGQPSRILNN